MENSMFRFTKNEDVACEINNFGCGRTFSRHETSLAFSLNLETTVEQQSIQGLLNKMLDPHSHQIPEYKCEMENGIGCNKRGYCTKPTSITDIVNIFIIQLMIFSCKRLGSTQKFIPNLIIDQEIRRFELFALQGIIWHEGNSMNWGYYTSTINVNNTWFIANDTVIREGGRSVCSNNDYITPYPYVLVYKKVTDFMVPSMIQVTFSTTLIMLKNEWRIFRQGIEFPKE